MKIRGKIFVSIMSMAFILFVVVVGYLGWNFRKSSLIEAKKLANSFSMQAANLSKAKLDDDMATVRTLADIFSDYSNLPYIERKQIYEDMMVKVSESHPKYLSVWVSWELSAIRSDWLKPYGREKTEVLKIKGKEVQIIDTLENIDGDIIGSLYHQIKISPEKEFILNPYFYSYKSKEYKDSIFETSIAVQIRKKNKYKGLVGVDVELSELQTIIDMPIPFDSSYMFLVTNDGTFVAHPNRELIGQSIINFFDKRYSNINFLKKIENGEVFHVDNKNINGDIVAYTSFSPIYVGNTKTPWSVGVTVPIDVITYKATHDFYYTVIVGLLGFIFLTIIIFIISEDITRPLHRTIKVLHKLDKGDINLNNKLKMNRSDEIFEMSESVNKLIDTLNSISNFAVKIGNGELDAKLRTMGKHDVLANALLEMRTKLYDAEQKRLKRIEEAKKRIWIQNGISKISEKLQPIYNSKEELSFILIRTTVKYLDANQGGFFIVGKDDDGKTFLEMKASYAYNRKRKLSLKVEIGEGLVGRCAQEKQIIYLSNVPDGYTFISSGLGEDKPKELILIPLLLDNKVFGVIEISTFKRLEDYQMEFLEITAQRIASVLANMKITEDTSKLLEKFKNKSKELKLAEQELTKTIKHLKKAQSEIMSLDIESKNLMTALTSVASIVFYDMNGKITNSNQKNLEILGVNKKDFIGKTHLEVLDEAKENIVWFEQFWNDLREGKKREKEYYLKYFDKEIWLHETFIPIIDKNGKPEKVINIGIDITKRKLMERKIAKKLDNTILGS